VGGVELTVWDPEARALFAEWEDGGPRVDAVASGFAFVEGPVWVPHLPGGAGLLFSDIPADTIYRWRPGDAAASVWRRPSGHSNGQTLDRRGRLLTCEHARRRLTRTLLRDGEMYGEEPAVLAARHGGRRLNSPNDVVVRSDGSVFFTDPTYGLRDTYGADARAHQEQSGCMVYRLAAGAAAAVPDVPDPASPVPPPEPTLAASGFTQPNGLAFSPDERVLYVGDSAEGCLRAFDVDAEGGLASGRVLCTPDRSMGPGSVDGMRVDAAGRIWTTGPGGVWVLAPQGQPLAHVRFPEVTANLAFGEADRRTLFVTASTSLYRLRLAVPAAEAAV
jgi:gluconolactonase